LFLSTTVAGCRFSFSAYIIISAETVGLSDLAFKGEFVSCTVEKFSLHCQVISYRCRRFKNSAEKSRHRRLQNTGRGMWPNCILYRVCYSTVDCA